VARTFSFRDPLVWLLPALSAGLLYWAYYPIPLPVPNLIGLIPLLAWLDVTVHEGPRAWWKGGLVFGVFLNLTIMHWMYSMLAISWLAVGAYLGLVLMFSLCQALAITILGWLRRRTRWSFVILLPAVWLPMEWLQAQGDLRMTAQHIGHSLAGFPFLIQIADLVGPYGVGALILAVNALGYDVLSGIRASRWKPPTVGLVVLVSLVLVYDAWRWYAPPQSERWATIAIVQPNIPLAVKMDGTTDAWQWSRLEALSREAADEGAELIVWPETARPSPVFHIRSRPASYVMADVADLARETGATFLVGAEYVDDRGGDDYEVYNAAMVVRPDGRLDPIWSAKSYLVPFVEGVPFRSFLGPLLERRRGALRWLAGGFEPGRRGVVLSAGPVRVGASICFEELYFDLQRRQRRAGAQVQVILTNHAWFGSTFFQRYAADVVRSRAIENRTWFARVSNTGISGFVDPLGRYHDEIGLFEKGYAVRKIGLTDASTVYDRVGDLAVLVAALGLTCAVIRAARGRGEG
jgi:apolipoprotein N-acyltransferase